MGVYAAIADVRARGVTVEQADDAAVTLALDRATVVIESFCRRDFLTTGKTLKVDGSGTTALFLEDRPIVSIAEVRIDDALVPSEEIVVYGDAGYIRLDGGVTLFPGLVAGIFSCGSQNVTVRGVFGFATVPLEVKEAAVLLAVSFLAPGKTATSSPGIDGAIGVSSVRVDDVSVSFQYPAKAAPPEGRTTGLWEADRLLLPHRRAMEAAAV